jgi:hypothetical protein
MGGGRSASSEAEKDNQDDESTGAFHSESPFILMGNVSLDVEDLGKSGFEFASRLRWPPERH